MRPRWMKMIFLVPLAMIGITLFVAIGGEVVMRLWNWLLPSLFGWRLITFWQALGILALCRILVGGFGHGSGHQRGRRMRMKDRCRHMTPEERERVRQGIREGWAVGPPANESKGQ